MDAFTCSSDDGSSDLDGSQRFMMRAHDEDGCKVISSLLQDSILHVSFHSFHEDKRCLRLVLNRFCWELLKENEEVNDAAADSQNTHSEDHPYFRMYSGLYIHNVKGVWINDNFKEITRERYLNLLALCVSENRVNLIFSGCKNIGVSVDKLDIYLKDLGGKYPTSVYPRHEREYPGLTS